ncbi:MAG: diguanylate cyclase [bacterium]
MAVLPGLQPSERAELRSLAAEADPDLFSEAVLNIAFRAERAGREEAALGLYSTLLEATEAPPIQRRARERLSVLLGRSIDGVAAPAGARAEFLFRRLAMEAAEPTSLLALGAASSAYRLVRLGVLSRLAAAPAGVWTRGWAAHGLAAAAGFAVEAPTFTLSARLGAAALGRSVEWSLPALGRDLASSYLVLGAMKFSGWGAASLYRRVLGEAGGGAAWQALSRHLFAQTGMFAGILLGHGLEERAGLRPASPAAFTLVDSLALLLQFNIAGRLAHHAFGPGVAAWEGRAEALARREPAPAFGEIPRWPPGRMALAGAAAPGVGGFRPEAPDRGWSLHMAMGEGPGGEGGGARGRTAPRGSRSVALSPVLRRAMQLYDPKALGEVLQMIYARVHGPLRAELLNVLVLLESGQPVSQRIRSLLKDGRIYRTQFLSPEVQRFVSERIREHEQEADLLAPEATTQSLGPRRPNLRAVEAMAAELGMKPEDVVRVLNRIFSPQIDLTRFASFRGEPIYVSNMDDEHNLAEYGRLGRQSLGEYLFFARKNLSRNWMLHEAARHLGIRAYQLQRIERNQRRPNPRQMEKFARVYELDPELLRELRAQSPVVSSPPPQHPAPADTAPRSQLALPGLSDPPPSPPAVSLRLTGEAQLQRQGERLRQLQQLQDSVVPTDELFREALELADYFEGIVRETRHRAERDLLTGLRNRQGLARITPRLERRLNEQRRQRVGERASDWVLMIDIDFFKRVNDSFGHPNGDRVLRDVAQTLAQTVRWRKDITARLGGEEFFAFLSASGKEGALEAAERIRQEVAKMLIPLDDFPPIQVSVSVGAAELRILPPPEGGSRPRVEGALADAIDRADRALYEAKEAGRDRVWLSSE